jgi:2-oxo-4-hydroxy-4-carboxy-5-ureidoimidazoline decarboxylase
MNFGDLNTLDRAGFVAALGAIFEHSPWIAERAWDRRPFEDSDSLMAAMIAVVEAASNEEKLALIRAHPDLAGKAARAGALTAHSTAEQAGAGLDRLTDEEFGRFHRLNDAYKTRFGFPFVIAVRGHTKETILAAFETRLAHDPAAEMAEAIRNIGLIARFRLEDLVAG